MITNAKVTPKPVVEQTKYRKSSRTCMISFVGGLSLYSRYLGLELIKSFLPGQGGVQPLN